MPTLVMTRRLSFAAAHILWNDALSEAENRALFGASASPVPSGRTYTLDVAVRGAVEPRTGIVVNIKEIDRITKERVTARLNETLLNDADPFFKAHPPVPEQIAHFIALALAPCLPPAAALEWVRLRPSAVLAVTCLQGKENHAAMQLTRTYDFSASHRLNSLHLSPEENAALFGKCNYPSGHGHNYELEITVSGPTDPRSGRIIDPDALDAVVEKEVVERYDHRHLNLDIPEFAESIPSAEMITRTIWQRLQPHIPGPAKLHRVLLRETARNFFEYYGEDDEDL